MNNINVVLDIQYLQKLKLKLVKSLHQRTALPCDWRLSDAVCCQTQSHGLVTCG